MQTLNWKDGKATYKLMLSSTSPSGGDLNLANINYMRIYMNGWPADFTDQLTIKVDNVRLVDITNELSLPTVFSDGMLFQQNKPINIWGYHKEGSEVEVKFYKGDELLGTKTATADADGKWQVTYPALEGGYDTYRFEVSQNGKLIQAVEDVLIGELWLACGQSNMALSVSTDMDAANLIAEANNPYLRVFLEPTYPSGQTGEQPVDPAQDIPGAVWGRGDNGAAIGRMSAVAYSFAKELQETLDVPVGVLNTAIGGTVIEGWLPRDAVEADAEVKAALKKYNLYYDAEWWPTSAGSMSTLYNQKIGPLEGLNIAGTIWYQGESNSNRAEIYDIELNLLKKSWSEKFGFENNTMPFIFTQVAPYRYDNGSKNPQHLGYLAESMENSFRANEDNNMAMLTIYDLPLDHMRDGTSSDPIHPRIKTPVGQRFALAALNMVYGGGDEYTAPVYTSMEIKDHAIYITFDRVGDGLMTIRDATLHGFAIAGEDNVFVGAKAEIVDDNTVKVWSNRVSDPKNVTYAFDNFNQSANLINAVGIPASPFRTVDVDDTTLKPAASIRYFTAQDWMFADGDAWVYDSTFTEERNTGVRPSWTTTGATYDYSMAVSAEGTYSLKLTYDKGGDIAFGPVLSYESLQLHLGLYNTLTVKVLNPDAREKTLGLTVTSGGKTYDVAGGATIAQGEKFTTVTFDLTALTLNGTAVTGTSALLNLATALTFTFHDTQAGMLYIDDISVGMTDAVVDEAVLDAQAPTAGISQEELKLMLTIVEGLEVLCTEESVNSEVYQTAKQALAAVVENADATFAQRNNAADDMIKAWNTLELKPIEPPADVDKSVLEEALALDESLYTEESLNEAAYQQAKAAAQAVFEDEFATQDEVDAATEQLLAAQALLVLKQAAEVVYGDVNADGEVDSSDARIVLQSAVGKVALTEEQTLCADVDGNDTVDSSDARLILQYAVNKIGSFPVEE